MNIYATKRKLNKMMPAFEGKRGSLQGEHLGFLCVGTGKVGSNLLNEKAIILDKLTKKFEDVVAVDGLSLEVEKGELFGLLGANGARKTTTINVLCCIFEPTSGSVCVGGCDVRREPEKIKELIGVCPQDTAVFSRLTGRENIELFGKLHTMPKEKLKKNTDARAR